MRATGKGVSDGDKEIDGEIFNGNDWLFAGRPEFTEEGTARGDIADDGIVTTPAHEGRASIRYNVAELIAFGDII